MDLLNRNTLKNLELYEDYNFHIDENFNEDGGGVKGLTITPIEQINENDYKIIIVEYLDVPELKYLDKFENIILKTDKISFDGKVWTFLLECDNQNFEIKNLAYVVNVSPEITEEDFMNNEFYKAAMSPRRPSFLESLFNIFK